MKRTGTRLSRVALIPLAVLLVAAAPAFSQEAELTGDGYQAGTFGRVRYEENGATLRRAAVEQDAPPVEDGTVNSPVFPGDTLSTAGDQRVEVELSGGSLVRVDRDAELTFLALPDPYAEIADNTVLQLLAGTIRIAAVVDENSDFRVDTPSATVYLLDDGDYRVEVTPSGRTSVASRRGVAEVVALGASVLVRGGTQTEILLDARPAEPRPFNTLASDGFDRWADERDAEYERYVSGGYDAQAYESVPDEVRPYYRELGRYGDWSYVDDYGYVWRPTRVSTGWRPYYDGYWDYGPHGYFWVSYEPWGWAPYRYGRWSWVGGSWCWVPGRVFSGAWVAWSWGSLQVGWAPLDYWNRPAFYGPYSYGYYDPHCWTFLGYGHLRERHYQRYAVQVDRVVDIRQTTVVTRAPRISPRRLAESDGSRQRAVREARESGATARRIDRSSRPATSMRDTERRLIGSRGAATRAAVAPADGRERRRTTVGRANGLRRDTALGTRPGSPAGRRDAPQVGRSSAADARVRDLYRRMASPRTTRERSSAAGSARGSTPATPNRARGTTADREKARQSNSGSQSRRPAAGAKRSGTSRSRDRAPSPAPQMRPEARPGSGTPRAGVSSSTPRPRATAGRSSSRSTAPPRPSAAGAPRPRPSAGRAGSRSAAPPRPSASRAPSPRPSASRGSSRSSTPSRNRSSGSSRSRGKKK